MGVSVQHQDDTEVKTLTQGNLVPDLPGASRQRPRIRWNEASGPQERRLSGSVVVGAAPDVDVVLADPKVSRLHAELAQRPDGLWVADLGSRNGTYVDRVRVASARLHEGARLRLGDTELVVGYEASAEPVPLWRFDRFGPLIGRSVAMRELFEWLDRAARSDATLLVEGETGTGKELVACAVHETSPRGSQPFAIIDCAALSGNLLEAELFGHARGAFTGAHNARAGAIEAADGGTVFIDEVGELPLSLQPKLLRVLESRTVRRLGENQRRPVDVRFIAATHRDLRAMVNDGTFREDLYFRLAVLKVRVPPLRERLEDVPALASHFLPEGTTLPPELSGAIERRPWRGNVRELRNFVERLLAFGAEHALRVEEGRAPAPLSTQTSYHAARADVIARFERDFVERLLERHPGNLAEAARAAGLTRAYLYQLLRKHGLRGPS